jgi:uncharacterized protein
MVDYNYLPAPSRERILSELKRLHEQLEREYHIREIGLFGSMVRNEGRDSSDIDILISFSQTPDLFTFVRLEQYLTEIFNKKVDLVLKDSLKPHISEYILSEVIYA